MLALVVDEEALRIVPVFLVGSRHFAEFVVDRDLSVIGATSLD